VGLKGGPLSLVSTIEELLGRKSSGSGLENREYGHRDPSHWPHGTLYPQKSSLTSPTSGGGLSIGIFRSLTQTTEFFMFQILKVRIWKRKFLVRQVWSPKFDSRLSLNSTRRYCFPNTCRYPAAEIRAARDTRIAV
jgi:hypothetical protein